jgi:hypothetical protein
MPVIFLLVTFTSHWYKDFYYQHLEGPLLKLMFIWLVVVMWGAHLPPEDWPQPY